MADLKRTQEIPAKEQHKSTGKQKRERYKIACNLLRDSPHPDPASCDNQ